MRQHRSHRGPDDGNPARRAVSAAAARRRRAWARRQPGRPGRRMRHRREVPGMKDGGRTILLVDDHAIVREGYRTVLQKQPGLRVVAEAADGAEAYRRFKETRPDLVIMDLSMAGVGGIEAIR